MKKATMLLAILLMFIFPLQVYAYSNQVIPGGENVGIEIKSKGIMIIGFYKVNGKLNKGSPNLKVGDSILAVNGIAVENITDLVTKINDEIQDGKVELTYIRNKSENKATLTLSLVDGVYKTGLYVKDSLTGIGTLTYIDPQTGIYGALGHEVIESNTENKVEVKTGSIFRSSITSIDKSVDGTPGGKNAKFYYKTTYGSIYKNTGYGIYGRYTATYPEKRVVEVAKANEIKLGKATIMTVLAEEKVETFEIEITRVIDDTSIKNIHFKITDERLLSKTGGVVQGMSGSPILQNGKIIGAVTHVIVDNVQNGYGIFITTMLEEGER